MTSYRWTMQSCTIHTFVSIRKHGIARGISKPGRTPTGCAQGPKERAQVRGQQLRLFKRREVPAARHLGPALQVEEALRVFAWRRHDVLMQTDSMFLRGIDSTLIPVVGAAIY